METPREVELRGLVETHLPGVDAEVAALHLTLLHLGRMLRATLVHPTADSGLGGTEYAVLLNLLFAGPDTPMTPGRLARDVTQTTSGISKTVRRLERVGLVRLEPNPADLRSRSVLLTDEGAAVARQQVEVMVERWHELFPGLDDAVVAEMGDAARLILRHLSS